MEAVPKTAGAVHFRWFQLWVAFPLAEVRKKMAGEACLFADIADMFAAVLRSYLLAVLRALPAFVVARPDTVPDTGFGTARVIAPDTGADILRAPALRIASETRAALGASRPVGNLLDPASALHPAEIRFRADAPRLLVAPPAL